MTSLPIVVFTRATLCESNVRRMVGVSRTVARWNGNRTHRRVNLITDDFDTARAALTVVDRDQTRATLAQNNTGLFWPHSGVIWCSSIRSTGHPRRVDEIARSIVHEIGHSATRGHHPREWRRMYAILLPLWWQALQPYGKMSLRYEVESIVHAYAGKRLSLERQYEEIDSHMRAADRTFARWVDLAAN